ncbi:MAG: hypothetical protein IJ631_07080 [Schwartzia sp.]|nr:hypothetical protein [Schwartzia sp. (in: firmicutes)]
MKIKELDVVLLKDGQQATVRDIYRDESGSLVYHVSMKSEDPADWLYVKEKDIERVVWSADAHKASKTKKAA